MKRSIREQWLGVESLCKDLRRALIRRQLSRHPWKTVSAVVKDSLRLLERLAHSPGLTVILLSEDRMVAPAVGEKLVVSLRDTFNPGRGVHREATALGAGPGESVPPFHGGHLPPKRTGSLAARLGRSIMSSVSFVLQRRLALFRNGLVLIHGCASDISADESNGQHQIPSDARCSLLRLAATADCVFLLNDVPEGIAASRRMPAAPHVPRAVNGRSMVAELADAVVIDATQSSERVILQITAHVLQTMARRASRRGFHDRPGHVLPPAR